MIKWRIAIYMNLLLCQMCCEEKKNGKNVKIKSIWFGDCVSNWWTLFKQVTLNFQLFFHMIWQDMCVTWLPRQRNKWNYFFCSILFIFFFFLKRTVVKADAIHNRYDVAKNHKNWTNLMIYYRLFRSFCYFVSPNRWFSW